MMRTLLLVFALPFAAAPQGVIDRVAVVVGNQVITETEVLTALRLTQFFNGQPLDLSAAARKEAAEHLVDQQLIRSEMQVGGYQVPAESEADALLRQFRQQHHPNEAAYRAMLQKYGLTEADIKQRLLWQVAALRFTEQRFRQVNPPQSAQSANRSVGGTPPAASQADEEDEMDAWLKQARSGTRISFKKEAFQ